MKLSHILVSAMCFAALGCSKPKAFAAAEEWHKVGDTEKEELCKKLTSDPAALLGALNGWVEKAKPSIEGKSKEFAAAIGELKEKGDFEKLKKMIDGYDSLEEPCDKVKAAFNPDQGKAYFDINSQIQAAIKPAADAYEAKAKEFGITVDMTKFRP